MIGLSSGKSGRDDPDVAVAEAMQCSASGGSRLSDFSGKQPLHPWLSLTEQCFVAELSTSLCHNLLLFTRGAQHLQVAGEKRGAVWCHLQFHGRTAVLGRTHPKLGLIIANLFCFS